MEAKRKTIMFPAHGALIDLAAEFAQELKRRRGIDSIVLLQGTRDAIRARRMDVFAEVVDVVADLRLDSSRENLAGNLQALTAFERKYGGPSVWQFIVQDAWWRVKHYSYPQVLQYMSHAVEVLESLFARWDVIAAVGELTSPVYRLVHQMFGQQRPYLCPMTARFFHRIYFDSDVYLRWEECLRVYRRFMENGFSQEVDAMVASVLQGIRESRLRPVYMDVNFKRAAKDSGLRRVRPRVWAIYAEDIWYNNIIDGPKSPQGLHWTYWLPPRKLARWAQWAFRRRYYHRRAITRIPPNARLALFLPTTEPEYTLDVQGWPFTDQASLVRSVAQSLPVDMLLLVKDHQLMVGPRSIDFYRRILKLPNVRLVDERISSQDLLRASKIVFTVTGTVALEAVCCGVPAMMFGRVFINELEGVTVVRDLYELPAAIESALKGTEVDFDRSARAMLAAMYTCSFPGRIDAHLLDPGEMPPGNRLDLGNAIEEELGRRGLLAGDPGEEPLVRTQSSFLP